MKKLMTAIAVAGLSAAVFGDVTSANVVGYNQLDNGNSTMMLGIPFESVSGKEGITLGELTCDGGFGRYDYIEEVFVYFDEDDQDFALGFEDYVYKAKNEVWGWYDESNKLANDHILKPGTAVYFCSNDPEVSKAITVAGQVISDTFVHPAFDETTEMVASAFPIGFNPNDKDRALFTGLTKYDYIEVQYVYFDEDDQDYALGFDDYIYKSKGDVWGWYDDSNKLVSEPITLPGQGFYLCCQNPEEVTLTEYSPLKK